MHGIRHMVLSNATTSIPMHWLGIWGTNISFSDFALYACCWESCAFSIMDLTLTFGVSKRNSLLINGF